MSWLGRPSAAASCMCEDQRSRCGERRPRDASRDDFTYMAASTQPPAISRKPAASESGSPVIPAEGAVSAFQRRHQHGGLPKYNETVPRKRVPSSLQQWMAQQAAMGASLRAPANCAASSSPAPSLMSAGQSPAGAVMKSSGRSRGGSQVEPVDSCVVELPIK